VFVLGCGLTLTVSPLTATVLAAIDVQRAGVGSAINNAVARVAGLLAVAVFSIVLLGVFSGQLDRRLAALDIPAEVRQQVAAQRLKLAGAEVPPQVDPATRALLVGAIGESFVAGYRVVMLLASGLALASAASAGLLIAGRPAERSAEPTDTQQPLPAS